MASYFSQQPAAFPLLAAIAANSYFFYGNLGALTTGVIPYVRNQSSPQEEVKGTNWFIEKGKATFFASSVLSSALFGYTAYLAPTARIQNLVTVAAVSALMIGPYTAVFMLPTNGELAQIEADGTRDEEKALARTKTWRAQHAGRVLLGAVGWVAGIVALEML